MKEKTIENKIKDYLFSKYIYYFKVHGSKFMEPGIPDIVACVKGHFVGIEVKRPGAKNEQSEQQKIHERNIKKSGGTYLLVDSLQEVINYIEPILYKENQMNLLIIGNNTDDLAMDIWKGNTNYTVLNQNPYVFGEDFRDFVKTRPVIVSTTIDQFLDVDVNDVIDIIKEYEFIPILIADDDKDTINYMYTILKDEELNTLLYTRNEENIGYDELVEIAQGYLLGKGLISDDTTVRTSEEGEGTPPQI